MWNQGAVGWERLEDLAHQSLHVLPLCVSGPQHSQHQAAGTVLIFFMYLLAEHVKHVIRGTNHTCSSQSLSCGHCLSLLLLSSVSCRLTGRAGALGTHPSSLLPGGSTQQEEVLRHCVSLCCAVSAECCVSCQLLLGLFQRKHPQSWLPIPPSPLCPPRTHIWTTTWLLPGVSLFSLHYSKCQLHQGRDYVPYVHSKSKIKLQVCIMSTHFD